jgi:hypothetical protein
MLPATDERTLIPAKTKGLRAGSREGQFIFNAKKKRELFPARSQAAAHFGDKTTTRTCCISTWRPMRILKIEIRRNQYGSAPAMLYFCAKKDPD